MARRSKKDIEFDVVQEAKERLDKAYQAGREQRDKAVDDLLFAQVEGSQWQDRDDRKGGRPRFEVNKIAAHINQVIGEYRQNRVGVKVRPAGGNATTDLADTFNGLIRNIENVSNAKNAYDSAYDLLVNSGFGAWRIITEYEEGSFNQVVRVKGIPNALTKVWMDPVDTDPNKRNAMWGFVLENMSREEFAKKYPNSPISDFSVPENELHRQCGAFETTIDKVTIGEYWRKVPVTKELALLDNGQVVDLDEIRDVLDDMNAQVVRTRKYKTHKVEMYIVSGLEVLEGPMEWAGSYIPIIPVFGFNYYVDAQHYYHGVVRPARDAQTVFNYALSANIEAVALSPKDPYFVSDKQVKGFESQYANFNVENRPFLFFNPDPENPGPPKRGGAPSVQTALVQTMQQAEMDIQSTTGRFSANLGDNPANESGRALLAQQKQGDLSTQILLDNMTKGRQYTGEILVDLLPKIYDTERQERILGEDGGTEFVQINSTVIDEATGKPVIVNDLSQGIYDVMADTSPSYATQRTEAVNALTTLATAQPELAPVMSDLISKNLDFPFSEELTSRIRRLMISQGAIEPNEQEAQEMAANMPQPDPMQEVIAQINLERERLTNLQIQANIEATMANANNFNAGADQKLASIEKTMTEMAKIVSDIRSQDHDNLNKDADTLSKLKDATTATMKEGEALMVSGEGLEVREDQLDLIEGQQESLVVDQQPTGQI